MTTNQYKIENSLLNYDYTASCISTNEYVLTYNNKYYKIGEFMYQILEEGKKVNYLDDLIANLDSKTEITVASLKEIIETNILPVFKSNRKLDTHLSDSFWWKKQVLTAKRTAQFSKPIAFLFGNLFYPLLFILTFLNVFVYRQISRNIATASVSQGYEILGWIVSYFLLFTIIFLHELGHAAAAIKLGIKARSIGLGFYTIMPAMFTDLTDIWKLNRAKKIKINLAGIFIQLIINIILITSIAYTKNSFVQSIFWKLYFVNCFTMVMNLIPFLKFDGYWVLSDYFGMPNLIQASNKKLLDAITKKDPFDDGKNENSESKLNEIVLIVYTILRVVFVATFIFFVFAFIYVSLQKTIILIKFLPYLKFNFQTSIELLKRIATITVILLFTRKYKKMFSNIIFKKATWYKV